MISKDRHIEASKAGERVWSLQIFESLRSVEFNGLKSLFSQKSSIANQLHSIYYGPETLREVTCMPLWRRLYNTIWLAFFSCVLVPRWMGASVGLPVHALLGIWMLVITQMNIKSLQALSVPARLKRISKATAGFALFQLATGLALGAVMHLAPTLPFAAPVLRGLHIVSALTILAQASSVATGYDMWEEKEFGESPSQS